MNIKILGTGCVNCNGLEANTRTALADLGVSVEIDQVTDPGEIVAWGVMSTPPRVIDEEVVLSGRVPHAGRINERLSSR